MSINFNKLAFETSFGKKDQLLESYCMEFVFSGRSNVGKSSLINKVLNCKNMAKISSMPGKTSTINFFKVDNIRFVDLPGYGYAKVSKSERYRWNSLVSSYLQSDRNIGVIFQLIDVRHAPSKQDIQMINFFVDTETPFIIILTKVDKLKKSVIQSRLKEIVREIPYGNQINMIPFSAVSGMGVKEIRAIINDIVENENIISK